VVASDTLTRPQASPSGTLFRGAGEGWYVTAAALIGLVLIALGAPVAAAVAEEEVGLKVPRFVSLHADRVNLRTGPGRQYPIEWVLTKKGMPVEIIAQFEQWRRVREWDGTVGWVQERMVTGKRTVVVDKGSDRPLHRQPDPASAVVARAEPGVMARLAECRGPWCRVEAADRSGWMRRTDLWGVYPGETVP
jgi:SH3-like domain-containing protein